MLDDVNPCGADGVMRDDPAQADVAAQVLTEAQLVAVALLSGLGKSSRLL